MRRTKVQTDLTRQRLIDTALEVFLEQGYSRTTLDQIARRAGMTRGAAYWHFPDGKPALFNTLVREKSQLISQRVMPVLHVPGSPVERLQRLLLSWCEMLETDSECRKIYTLTTLKTEYLPELEHGIQEKLAANRALIDLIKSLLQQEAQQRAFTFTMDSELAAMMIYAQLWGMVNIWLLDPAAFPLSTYANKIFNRLIQNCFTSAKQGESP